MHRTAIRFHILRTVKWEIFLLLVIGILISRSYILMPFFVVSLLGFKFSSSEDMDSPPDARCGAMCSLCSSYQRGHCKSCAFGNAKLRVSCPIFTCAEEKQTVCTQCPEMLHCTTYREYANKCPFQDSKVLQDTLPKGGFLVKECILDDGLNLFIDRVIRGDLGLIIMRQPPAALTGSPHLKRVPVVQLNQTTSDSSCLDPTNLAKLHMTFEEFFKAAPRSTILLEGMEYLIIHNGVDRMLKFVHSIAECAKEYSSRFITIIDPRVLEDEEMVLLERELTTVAPG
jgi:hypothetical protein